jgi:hypothetical protein
MFMNRDGGSVEVLVRLRCTVRVRGAKKADIETLLRRLAWLISYQIKKGVGELRKDED